MKNYLDVLSRVTTFLKTDPANPRRALRDRVAAASARAYARSWTPTIASQPAQEPEETPPNELRKFFESRHEGPGIWKWEHYFDIYNRHFARFVGRPVRILEIGIYSGGSLDMWQAYFGKQCEVIGVDIEEACKVYERPSVQVLIGDQADRKFWGEVKRKIGPVDIVIDDGGHLPQQQIITLEETLPLLRPNGVFLCEDIHGADNAFLAYVTGLMGELNTANVQRSDAPFEVKTTPFQESIGAITVYPFVVVVEKNGQPVAQLKAPKHGTQWQPFL